MLAKIIAGFLVGTTFVMLCIVLSALFALPVEWLWNGTLVDVFPGAVKNITFMQAWGLNILCSFLFKSNNTSNSK